MEKSQPPQLDYSAAARLAASLREGSEEGSGADLPRVAGYLLERHIGGGGGGEVYLARKEGSDRRLALKLCRGGSAASRERAWRELSLLEGLRVAGVPRLIDYGIQDGRVFIASEFVEGEELVAYCEGVGLSRRGRVELLASVAEVVHGLHERGVIHRDIKPSNIIVDGSGQPAVVDFGIARLLEGCEQTLTEGGEAIGSPAFMAPEQARGDGGQISTRTDVYGLGATAYVVLTGKTPHESDTTVHAAVRRVAEEEPRDPRSLAPDLPRPLAAVLSKAVSREAVDRYASAAEFGADLRRWLGGEAVLATPPGVLRRVGRVVGRHPVAATGFSAVCVGGAVLLATVGSVWWLNQRPFMVVVDEEQGRWARLVARSGRILHEWRSERDRGVGTGKLVELPRGTEYPSVVVTAINQLADAPAEWADQLCVWDPRDLREPVWHTRGTAPQTATPGGPVAPPEHFNVSREALVADIFPEHPSPGVPEVVVILCHHSQDPSVIRVYDIQNGDVLYEAWHWGAASQPHWLAEAGVLVLKANNNVYTWLELGYPGVEVRWPQVCFGIEPRMGARVGWINGTGREQPVDPPRARFYKVLWPPEAYGPFVLGPPRAPRNPNLNGGHFAVDISSRERSTDLLPPPRVVWLIDADGNQAVDENGRPFPPIPGDAYRQLFGLGKLPEPEWAHLGEMPKPGG